MKTFLNTSKEKKAFIIAALAVIAIFAIGMLLQGKANAAGLNNGNVKVQTVNVHAKKISFKAEHDSVRRFKIAIAKGIKTGSRISVILAYFGKPTFKTHRPLKLYYCSPWLCLIFKFGYSRITTKMLKAGKRGHLGLYGEKIVQIVK